MSSEPAFIEVSGKLFFNIGQERWERLKTFSVCPDDVFIAGYPRCGTTWTQQIVKLLRNGGKDDDQRLDLTIPFMEFIGSPPAKLMNYDVDLEAVPSPRAFKTNLPYEFVPGGLPHTTPAKYVYIARNPKDAAVSMWHHQSKMAHHPSRPWDEFFSSYFGNSPVPYGNCFDHILGWWKHHDAPNILFLTYEDMKARPYQNVEEIAKFIGVELTHELVEQVVEKTSFQNMKTDMTANHKWLEEKLLMPGSEGSYIRKGVVGDWKNHFTAEQNEQFQQMHEEKIGGSGLELNFGDAQRSP